MKPWTRPPRLVEALRRVDDARRTLDVSGEVQVAALRSAQALLSSAAHWVAEEMLDRLVADGVQRCRGHESRAGGRCSLPEGHAGEHVS